MSERKDFFEIVNVTQYHSDLFHNWLRLQKDGLVARDDEEAFVEYGRRFAAHIFRTKSVPDYGVVLSWVNDLNS